VAVTDRLRWLQEQESRGLMSIFRLYVSNRFYFFFFFELTFL